MKTYSWSENLEVPRRVSQDQFWRVKTYIGIFLVLAGLVELQFHLKSEEST